MQGTQLHDVTFTLDNLTSRRTPSVHVRCTLRTMLPSWCHVRLSWVCVSSGNGANNASPKAANTKRNDRCVGLPEVTVKRCQAVHIMAELLPTFGA